MKMHEIIAKKRSGRELSEDEIDFFVKGVADGSIPDYQISAFLMAVWFRGMTEEETVTLTECLVDSGEIDNLSSIVGKKVDKHSTGGVGDKVSLIVGPMVAAADKGICVPKMAGRGLGFTGGTLDKLESCTGVNTEISAEKFEKIVKELGFCIAGQSKRLAPAGQPPDFPFSQFPEDSDRQSDPGAFSRRADPRRWSPPWDRRRSGSWDLRP